MDKSTLDVIIALGTLLSAMGALVAAGIAAWTATLMRKSSQDAMLPYLAICGVEDGQAVKNVGPGPALQVAGRICWGSAVKRFGGDSFGPGELLTSPEPGMGDPMAVIEFTDVFGQNWRIDKEVGARWECRRLKGPRDPNLFVSAAHDAYLPREQGI